jgi:hypothetical protein
VTALLAGQVSDETRQQIDDHVDRCEVCRR